jgi:hypothetical protein
MNDNVPSNKYIKKKTQKKAIISMIQLPENIIAMIRKDATDISAIIEGNEKRDKLWKSIKVSRCGDDHRLNINYQTIDETFTRVINMYIYEEDVTPEYWDLGAFMNEVPLHVRAGVPHWEAGPVLKLDKTDGTYSSLPTHKGNDTNDRLDYYFTDYRDRDWFDLALHHPAD